MITEYIADFDILCPRLGEEMLMKSHFVLLNRNVLSGLVTSKEWHNFSFGCHGSGQNEGKYVCWLLWELEETFG